MASLREVKDRIASVKSTLKITSAMKLVASSKLRKAQKAIEGLRPYETTLSDILSRVPSARLEVNSSAYDTTSSVPDSYGTPRYSELKSDGTARYSELKSDGTARKTVIIAIASNSSLCGGFNANVIKKALDTIVQAGPNVEVWSLGRRMADAMRKAGYPSPKDCSEMVAHPTYKEIAALAASLVERYQRGEVSKVELVYSHFVTTSKQVPVTETFLPFELNSNAAGSTADYASAGSTADHASAGSAADKVSAVEEETDYIIEPSAEEVAKTLLPQVLNLKLYAAVLDSAAAEHAARTLAMQTASDNAKDLIDDLTLEYNKGRQQKITSEILDLVGGAQQ